MLAATLMGRSKKLAKFLQTIHNASIHLEQT